MKPDIPEVTIKRLPSYLRVLDELTEENVDVVSSAEMGRMTGFSSEQIRKDLAHFGAFGTRGVGYEVKNLQSRIRGILGLDDVVRLVLVGAGNLGRALAHYNRARESHLEIVHIFDVNEDIVGRKVAGVRVQHVSEMKESVAENSIALAVVAVPREAASEVIESLVEAGVKAILNFAPVRLESPAGVVLKTVDLTSELQSLAYYTDGT